MASIFLTYIACLEVTVVPITLDELKLEAINDPAPNNSPLPGLHAFASLSTNPAASTPPVLTSLITSLNCFPLPCITEFITPSNDLTFADPFL